VVAEETGDYKIYDDYRIMLTAQERQYFHVICLESALELISLVPERLKLDASPYSWNHNWPWTWSLMLRKWFEHRGQINLDKIVQYI